MFLKSFKLFGIFVLLFLVGCVGGAKNVVVDVNGEPVVGAFVVVGDEIVVTDEDGEFDLVGDEIVVLAEGYENFEGSLNEDGVVVLEVTPYQSVLGYVYDENGPLEEAVVVYLCPNSFQPLGFMPTDEGFVYFPGIAESNSTFLVLSGGYEVGVVSMDIDGEEDVFVMEMEKIVEMDMVSSGGGGFFETAYAQGSQEEYDKIQLYFEMAAALSQGAVIVQPFYVSPTTLSSLNQIYATYLEQTDVSQLTQEIQLLPNETGFRSYFQVLAFFKPEIDMSVGHSDIDIGKIDLSSPLFSNPLYQTNNVTWEPVVNSLAVETQRGMIDITADPADYQPSLIGSMNNVSIDIDAGGLFIDNGNPVSNVIIPVKMIDISNYRLNGWTHDITVDQIIDSMLNSGISGGNNFDIILTQSELEPFELKIRLELGGEISGVETGDRSSEGDDEILNFLIGEPAERGTSHPPLDPAFEDYLWCLHAVNQKYSAVYYGCLAEYGEPGADQAIADEIGKCLNDDPGYKADAEKCGE